MRGNPLLPLAEKCLGCKEDCLECTKFPEMPLKGRLHLKALATEAEMCNKLYDNMQKAEKRKSRNAMIALAVTFIIMAIVFFIGGPEITASKIDGIVGIFFFGFTISLVVLYVS